MAAWEPKARESAVFNYFQHLSQGNINRCPDIKILLGDKTFPFYKLVLCSQSNFFAEKAITGNEIKIPDDFQISADTFEKILKFMSGTDPGLSKDNVEAIEKASQKLGIVRLQKQCESYKQSLQTSGTSSLPSGGDIANKVLRTSLGGTGKDKDAIAWGKDYYDPKRLWKPLARSSIIEHYLGYLWNQNRKEIADVTIIVGGVAFKAHKIVLACHSNYFQTLFRDTDGALEIMVPKSLNITANTFFTLLKFAYTNEIEIDTTNLNEIYNAATRLKMPHLIKLIESKFSSALPSLQQMQQKQEEQSMMQQFGAVPSNAMMPEMPLNFDPSANYQGMPNNQSIPINYNTNNSNMSAFPFNPQMMSGPVSYPTTGMTPTQPMSGPGPQNLAQLFQTPHFLNCDVDTLVNLLSNDNISLANEFQVFNMALTWLKQGNGFERFNYLVRVMGCVRFSLMNQQELSQCVRLTLDWFKSNPNYRTMILKANWLTVNEQSNIFQTFVRKDKPRNYSYVPNVYPCGGAQNYQSEGVSGMRCAVCPTCRKPFSPVPFAPSEPPICPACKRPNPNAASLIMAQ